MPYIKIEILKKDKTTDGRIFYKVKLPNGNTTNIKEEYLIEQVIVVNNVKDKI